VSAMPIPKISTVLLALSIVAAVLSGPGADAKPGTLCEDLRTLQRADPMGLALYALYGEPTKDDRPENVGWTFIQNVDVDGDDIPDDVRLFCEHVGSLVRSDPCKSTITIFRLPKGSGVKGPSDFVGKTFEFEAYGFYFFRHRAKLYVVASADETQTKVNIYRVDGEGFTLVCEKLF
jgi:hypothetical protein